MKIAIGSDHAGFALKQEVKKHLQEMGCQIEDFGTYDEKSCHYPIYAQKVTTEVVGGRADRGVLICGTGAGMAIAANKVAGVRAANVLSPEFAVLAREHNDANVATLSARFVAPAENEAILDAFLSTPFGEGRHAGRVAKVDALDARA